MTPKKIYYENLADTIIDTVKYKIEHLTGIKVGKVNVSVEDIRV